MMWEGSGMLGSAVPGAVLGLRSACALADLSSVFVYRNRNCDSEGPNLAWPL